MRIWIDTSAAAGAEPVFGLHPVERHVRAIAKLRPEPEAVVLSGPTPPSADGAGYIVRAEDGLAGARLADYLATADGAVLALDGGAFVDRRLLALMGEGSGPACLRAGEGPERTALLRIHPDTPVPRQAATLLEVAERLVQEGAVAEVDTDRLPNYVVSLRREVPLTVQAVPDARARSELEVRLFRLNYKGSTDFLTKWVYPPLVWPLVRLCARWRVHPNWLTVLSVILAIVAVPLFAQGQWLAGLAAAYAMTVLDSVDGKVARLTLTDSRFGNLLDHGLDIVHPPFWYLAWAWGLGARGPGDPLFTAALWLIGFYVADRLVLKTAKARFGRGLHAVTRLDGAVRTWIARRNVNLAIFTLGLALGAGELAFLAVTIWQGLTLAWHGLRTAWLYPRGAAGGQAA